MAGPFEVNSPTINATELYQQDRVRYEAELREQQLRDEERLRQRRWKIIPHTCVVVGVLFLLYFMFRYVRRIRTKWPFVTLLLYGVFFVLLLVPLLWGVLVWFGDPGSDFGDWADLPEIFGLLYSEIQAWPLWLTFVGMILSQVCLLIIPVRTAHERPKPRRGIWLTAIAAGFLYTLLLFGVIISLLSVIFEDDWPEWGVWMLLGLLPLNWLVWLAVFRLFAKNTDPQNYLKRVLKWLIRGSILELLIAVPSHIIVRHKDACCAHMTTAAGIAAGLAVIFFAFGPGLYYLYMERINSKKPSTEKK